MALTTNGCWLSKCFKNICITQLGSSWKFHFAMKLCHVKSISWLFWWTLLFNGWNKDIDGWNIACIFNYTSTLIIITYTLPTYYLPTYLLIITYTLRTCYLLTNVTYTYILHTYLPTYLGTYRLLTYIT
jgi:hypothetical protein